MSCNIRFLSSEIGTPGSQVWIRIYIIRPGSWSFRFILGFIPLAPLVLRPLGLDWSCTISFPGLPACRWLTIGLLSFHNHVSQSLKIHLFLYICIYPIVLFLWRTLICYHLVDISWMKVIKCTILKPSPTSVYVVSFIQWIHFAFTETILKTFS